MRVERWGWVIAALFLSGCGPSEKQKAEWAEQKRIECLDKFCEGDKPPRPALNETTLKLNGQWFLAPNQYFSLGRAVFYWPSKTPMTGPANGGSYPEKEEEFSDVAIEIFLRHHDGEMRGPSRYDRIRKIEAEGRVISKETLRPGLEKWLAQEGESKIKDIWYVATEFVESDPDGSILSCTESKSLPTCGSTFIWRSGIVGYTRFHAKHAADWPEIYQEIQRVLSLPKKV